ncbi:DUF1189 domain-containing protein [Priestia abyssalis]|uniref:DUF1189 domain-containing protein n=1 Tax=Priestia abyssalis TaxID=1221450 RepID=UPI0009958BD6|nr:DUF1189 domain-containing protein [Priestia abyssalis]
MNVFKQLILSLYSPKKMSLFRFQGIGKTIMYVFVLTFISILPTSLFLGYGIIKNADITRDMLADKIPAFTISDGMLQASKTEPIIQSDEGAVFIFDPSGKITTSMTADYPYAVSLLQNEFVMTVNHEPHSFSYSLFQGLDLSKDTIVSYLDSLNSGLIVIVFLMIIGLYILAVGSKFIGITLFAYIGIVFKQVLHRNITYKPIWTLAAYSGTLTTILFTITKAMSIQVPGQLLLHWTVTGFMFFLTIKHIPARKKPSQP